MNLRRVLFVILIMGLWSLSALAAAPEGGATENLKPQAVPSANKAFGDPTDFMAAGMAGADYILALQSPTDFGWDWTSFIFTHSGNNSAANLYGTTANTLYQLYLTNPTVDLWNAMTATADWSVANGPDVGYDIDSSPDVVFLMNYASLPGVANPATYQDAAKAILDNRKLENGGTVSDLCDYLYGYFGSNGLAAWDAAGFCVGATMLADVYGAPYAADAQEFADYFFNDSFDSPVTGMFKVEEVLNDYDYYTLGVTGLIRVFQSTGTYPTELATLYGLLLDSQYADGSFNWKYGTVGGGADYQVAAYAIMALAETDPVDPLNSAALYDAAVWLGAVQDFATGGFLYGNGEHVPLEGAECSFALLLAADLAGGDISASLPTGDDFLQCAENTVMTFGLAVNTATPLVIGFEVVVDITAAVLPTTINFAEATTPAAGFFQVTGNVNPISPGVYGVTGPGPYSVNATFFSGAGISATSGLFTMTFDGLAESAVDVDVLSYNLRGPDNVFIFGDVSGAGFVVDCTAPLAVTDITADPHHNKVEVNWMHDGTDVDHYEVFSGVWRDAAYASVYPEYDDVTNYIPTRPADYAAVLANFVEWAYIGDVALLTMDETWLNAADRGVYYYEVFAVDAAGNASPAAAANDRATNYWLGDMYEDGEVAVADMGYLGSAFGTTSADGAYLPNADVGPTDDWSRVGIPTTDDAINFEDLMIFSMNFGVVSLTNKSETNISTTADLSWVSYDEGTYALRLNNATGLKGVHLRASLPEGASVTVTAGALLDQQSEMTFLRNIGEDLDVSLAITGVDNGFMGQGDLFIVESSVALTMEDIVIDLRGSDNSSIEVNLDGDAGTLTPRVFGLNAAYPNPFNPMTKISFSLPESQDVRLNVYGIDGKLVATLVNETRGAGLHEVIWNGQNDAGQVQASGLYFYRIEAGPYSQVQKMTLMK